MRIRIVTNVIAVVDDECESLARAGPARYPSALPVLANIFEIVLATLTSSLLSSPYD